MRSNDASFDSFQPPMPWGLWTCAPALAPALRRCLWGIASACTIGPAGWADPRPLPHRALGMLVAWTASRVARARLGSRQAAQRVRPTPPPRGPVSARCGVPVGPWDERSPEACRPPCSDDHHIGLAVPSRRATPNRASAPRASARFAELFGYLLTPPVSSVACPPRAVFSWRKTGSVWAAKGYQSLR